MPKLHLAGQVGVQKLGSLIDVLSVVLRSHRWPRLGAAQELVGATPTGRLLLFPQVFLAAVTLLDLPWVHVHAAALDLFSKVLTRPP